MPLLFLLHMLATALLGAAHALPPQMEQVLSARSSLELLGLTSIGAAGHASIKKAHRALAQACHPDRHCQDPRSAVCGAAHRATVLINSARDELLRKATDAQHSAAWEEQADQRGSSRQRGKSKAAGAQRGAAWEEPSAWEESPKIFTLLVFTALVIWITPRPKARGRRLQSRPFFMRWWWARCLWQACYLGRHLSQVWSCRLFVRLASVCAERSKSLAHRWSTQACVWMPPITAHVLWLVAGTKLAERRAHDGARFMSPLVRRVLLLLRIVVFAARAGCRGIFTAPWGRAALCRTPPV